MVKNTSLKEEVIYKPVIPEETRSKSVEDKAPVETMCLIDWTSLPVAKFVYLNEDLRTRVESDSPEWGFHAPFMANQTEYEKQGRQALRRDNIKKAVECYLGYIHNQMEFTVGLSRIQNVVRLNSREADSLLSPGTKNLSEFENCVLAEVNYIVDPKAPDATVYSWVRSLRKNKEDYWKTFADPQHDKPTETQLREIRELARDKKWFERASLISFILKEDSESVKDKLQMIKTYMWACPKCQLGWIHDGVTTAAGIRDDDKLMELLKIYAERQPSLDGKFKIIYGVLPGWFKEGLEYDSDEKEFREGYIDAKPLFIEVASAWEGRLSVEDKVHAISMMKPLIKIDEEGITRYHKKFKEDKVLQKDFEEVCQKSGISLTG
jgi:hypothetical protein